MPVYLDENFQAAYCIAQKLSSDSMVTRSLSLQVIAQCVEQCIDQFNKFHSHEVCTMIRSRRRELDVRHTKGAVFFGLKSRPIPQALSNMLELNIHRK